MSEVFVRTISLIGGLFVATVTTWYVTDGAGTIGTVAGAYTVSLTLGVTIVSLILGHVWNSGRRTLATLAILVLVAGEIVAILQTIDRIVATRETREAPVRARAIELQNAERRLKDALADFSAVPVSTPRLEQAAAAKLNADAAVVERATQRGCRENCRALLQSQVDNATSELDAARREIEVARSVAANRLELAKADLDRLPASVPRTTAAALGLDEMRYTIIMAVLASIGGNGLSIILFAIAGHTSSSKRPPQRFTAKALVSDKVLLSDVEPAAEPLKPISQPRIINADNSEHIIVERWVRDT